LRLSGESPTKVAPTVGVGNSDGVKRHLEHPRNRFIAIVGKVSPVMFETA